MPCYMLPMSSTDEPNPLISSRSPSYARARAEVQSPSPAPDAVLVGLMISAAHSEADVARDYGAAQSHTNAPEGLAGLATMHQDRAARLRKALSELGGDAGPEADLSASAVQVELADSNYDLGRAAMHALMTQTEAALSGLYDKLAEQPCPDWLSAELRAIRGTA